MSYQKIIEQIKPELENLIDNLKQELMKIQTSRISSALIEDITVEIEGNQIPLKRLGAIFSSSARELTVQPWDKLYLEPIVRAIERAGLGLAPLVDKDTIRLVAPPLTEETKKNLIRLLNQKKEETFQNIRHLRDRAWREIQEGFRQGEIREDDKYKGKDKLEEVVSEFRDKVEELTEKKEKEITG
ncbi:ribosome recycling factor [bacterium]|nr:ribosome recycling factor [bacterium]